MAETVASWEAKTVYVGCSGNFTVERVLACSGNYNLIGNDVTIYSSAIGCYLADQPFHLELKKAEGFEFLEDYMKTSEDKVATVELATRLVDILDSKGNPRFHNAYYLRVFNAYKNQFPTLHQKTLLKLKSIGFKLSSYFNGDVLDFLPSIPKDASFVVYPPFYAGDYTNMFKRMDYLFEWDKPTYNELDDNLLASMYDQVTSRAHWLFGTDTPQEKYKDNLVGMAQTTNRGVTVYLYASDGIKRVVVPEQKIDFDGNERLIQGREIGNHMTLTELTGGQFRVFRSQYINEKIRPGQETRAYGVLVDGYLVGCFAVSMAPSKSSGNESDVGKVYMLSDFPVAPTDYKRLSKLVLYAALSKEAQLLMERITSRRVNRLFTTAFSNNPESMKYRGVFKLYNRHEIKESERDKLAYGNKFMINYEETAGRWTLDEGLAIWKKKHGQRTLNANTNDQN
jgi:hypothetical protein